MRAFPTIVLNESRAEVSRYTAVMHLIIRLADEYVNVVEAFHRTGPVCETIISEESWPAKP